MIWQIVFWQTELSVIYIWVTALLPLVSRLLVGVPGGSAELKTKPGLPPLLPTSCPAAGECEWAGGFLSTEVWSYPPSCWTHSKVLKECLLKEWVDFILIRVLFPHELTPNSFLLDSTVGCFPLLWQISPWYLVQLLLMKAGQLSPHLGTSRPSRSGPLTCQSK